MINIILIKYANVSRIRIHTIKICSAIRTINVLITFFCKLNELGLFRTKIISIIAQEELGDKKRFMLKINPILICVFRGIVYSFHVLPAPNKFNVLILNYLG